MTKNHQTKTQRFSVRSPRKFRLIKKTKHSHISEFQVRVRILLRFPKCRDTYNEGLFRKAMITGRYREWRGRRARRRSRGGEKAIGTQTVEMGTGGSLHRIIHSQRRRRFAESILGLGKTLSVSEASGETGKSSRYAEADMFFKEFSKEHVLMVFLFQRTYPYGFFLTLHSWKIHKIPVK